MDIKGPQPIPPPPAIAPITTVATTAGSAGTGLPASASVDTLRLSGLPAFLQTGQQLQVLVAALEEGQLILQLPQPLLDAEGNRTWIQFRAPATLPAQVGQQLTVEVMDATPTHPVLKLTPASALPFTLQTALSATLQKQDSATGFFAALSAINQTAATAKLAALPEAIRTPLQMLWRQLPEPEQLHSAMLLKRYMQNTGEFLEANLAQSTHSERFTPEWDLRATLLRIASAVREQLANSPTQQTESNATSKTDTSSTAVLSAKPIATATSNLGHDNVTESRQSNTPPHPTLPEPQARQALPAYLTKSLENILSDLLHHSETALARTQTHQLQMAATDLHRPSWILELPVRHDNGVDIFDMRIHPDGKGTEQHPAAHGWTVMLAFDLDGLGPMRVQISLRGEQISTYWWAEQNTTVTLFHEYLDALRIRLQSAGLHVDQLRCQTGRVNPNLHTTRTNPYAVTRIDERI